MFTASFQDIFLLFVVHSLDNEKVLKYKENIRGGFNERVEFLGNVPNEFTQDFGAN